MAIDEFFGIPACFGRRDVFERDAAQEGATCCGRGLAHLDTAMTILWLIYIYKRHKEHPLHFLIMLIDTVD